MGVENAARYGWLIKDPYKLKYIATYSLFTITYYIKNLPAGGVIPSGVLLYSSGEGYRPPESCENDLVKSA